MSRNNSQEEIGETTKAELAQKLGKGALATIEQYAPHPLHMARALNYKADPRWAEMTEAEFDTRVAGDDETLRTTDQNLWVVKAAYARMVAKCSSEPVEDFRIDFEDGYGYRSDEEEDEEVQVVRRRKPETTKGRFFRRFKRGVLESATRALVIVQQ